MKLKQHLSACMTLVVATPVVAQRPDSLTGQLAHRTEHSSSRIVVVRLDETRSVQDTVLNVPRTRESSSRLFDVSWPPVLPSRLPNSHIGFAGDGSLVVERLALPGFPSQYDVIGARGELVDRFQLAPNTQIVASGNRDVYLTTRGGDGRLTLQRFSVRSR